MYYTYVKFEWDAAKAASNAQKHGITFEEAAETFGDPLALILDEPSQPDRMVLIGVSHRSRVIFTVYAERGVATIRIISARRATAHERSRYEEGEP